MYYRVEFAGCENLAHRLALDDVELLKEEPGTGKQALEARLLEPDVVVVIQIIDAHNVVAAIEQVMSQRRADEPGGPGNENLHFRMNLLMLLYGRPAARCFTTREGPITRLPPCSHAGSCFAIAMHRGTCRRARRRPSSRASSLRVPGLRTIRPRRLHAGRPVRSGLLGRSPARMRVPLRAPRFPARCRDSP